MQGTVHCKDFIIIIIILKTLVLLKILAESFEYLCSNLLSIILKFVQRKILLSLFFNLQKKGNETL